LTLDTRPGRVLVKICGLTTPDDARMVADAGADWVGLNFHPPSPRFVDDARAAEIIEALPPPVRPVGLFVDRPPVEVIEHASKLALQAIQLHGDEPPEDVAALARSGFLVVRAFRLKDDAAIVRMASYLDRCAALDALPDAVLVDAHVAGLPGGTGKTIDDDLLQRLPRLANLILAGGLTPENVADRVAAVRPWMVDVAGGVEREPGRKDPARVAAFVRRVVESGIGV
jgi:phosphoribosylanthranilate isomerase